ncbi:MAG: membrane dipeptidase [Deltaproteobacteria bacterium]|nr:membrane dipeptidase [Deltaproteobacteria bacterium]
MAITRRNFIKAGIGGVAALCVGQGVSLAQSAPANLPSANGIIVIGVEGSDLKPQYLQDFLDAGATVWQVSGNTMDFERFDEIDNFVKDNSSKVLLAKSYNDILAAKQAGKVAIVAGAQELYTLDPSWEESIVRDDPLGWSGNDWLDNPPKTQLSKYYERGLRIANLAYNFSNFFGGGCLDPTTPLSVAGQYIVRQMQEIGILVDTSHSSERTSLDIVKMSMSSHRPVVISHSNPAALDDNPRNASDRLIEAVAKTGGLIGLNTINDFLKWSRKDAPRAETGPFPPQASISQYVDMMDYVRRLVGIDYIGLGTDWTYGDPLDTDNAAGPDPAKSFVYPNYMIHNQSSGKGSGQYSGHSGLIQYVNDFNQVNQLHFLQAELKRRYSSVDVAKILGGNWMRVFRQAWNS